MSRPMVHPVGVELPVDQQPGVRMEVVPGKPGTLLGLGLRSVQLGCGAITLVIMASIDFTTSPSFRFLVAASGLLCFWSMSLASLDIYALRIKRHLRHLDWFFTIGDGIVGAIIFTAASMAGGITDFIRSDGKECAEHHCARYVVSTVFEFLGFFALLVSFLLNLSSWSS
uniref:Uncharacterized protein n=1 Tax=Avena sativa TaxID=4498 RepID=A0ACD5XGD1_AVESA